MLNTHTRNPVHLTNLLLAAVNEEPLEFDVSDVPLKLIDGQTERSIVGFVVFAVIVLLLVVMLGVVVCGASG